MNLFIDSGVPFNKIRVRLKGRSNLRLYQWRDQQALVEVVESSGPYRKGDQMYVPYSDLIVRQKHENWVPRRVFRKGSYIC